MSTTVSLWISYCNKSAFVSPPRHYPQKVSPHLRHQMVSNWTKEFVLTFHCPNSGQTLCSTVDLTLWMSPGVGTFCLPTFFDIGLWRTPTNSASQLNFSNICPTFCIRFRCFKKYSFLEDLEIKWEDSEFIQQNNRRHKCSKKTESSIN